MINLYIIILYVHNVLYPSAHYVCRMWYLPPLHYYLLVVQDCVLLKLASILPGNVVYILPQLAWFLLAK